MLIFFMVAGQIQPSDGVEVTPPVSSNETDPQLERLKIVESKAGELFIDGKEIKQSELATRLNQYIDTFSEQRLNQLRVELKADSELSVEQLQTVLKIIKSVGINRVSLITQSLGNTTHD